MIWNQLKTILNGNSSFLISSHVNPDGDCIGSQLALRWYLQSIGKDVVVYDRDEVPLKLQFLEGAGAISPVRPKRTFDVLILLDSSNPDRLGWGPLGAAARHSVNIDHHEDNTSFARLNIIDSASAATGQILFSFFSAIGVAYPPAVAQLLYVAIMTDTGGFRFSNTSDRVLHACGTLLEKGADGAEAYRRCYASDSPQGMMLKARIWSTLAFHLGNRVCTMELPDGLVEKLGANYGDSEGMADFTIAADGVEVGMLMKHSHTEAHFSLRSNGAVDVGSIARSIPGGGGHDNAAGCTICAPLDKARQLMLDILRKEIAP